MDDIRVIVGGGPTGVELAGAIVELARHGLEREFRAIDPANATVVLVQSAPRFPLPAFPPALSIDAATALRRLGVTVRLDAKVERVSAEGVVLAGQVIPARTVLWAAGVQASPATPWLDAERDRAGPGRCRTGSLGQGTRQGFRDWRRSRLPCVARTARSRPRARGEARRRLAAAKSDPPTTSRGRPAPQPFGYRHAGSLANHRTPGRDVADFHGLMVHGALA